MKYDYRDSWVPTNYEHARLQIRTFNSPSTGERTTATSGIGVADAKTDTVIKPGQYNRQAMAERSFNSQQTKTKMAAALENIVVMRNVLVGLGKNWWEAKKLGFFG